MIIETQIASVSDQLHAQLSKQLFQTVHESTELSGNTVSAADHGGNFPDTFLAMIKKIEFGVDKYGHASRPTMYIHPSQREKIFSSVHNQPDDYQQEVARVSKRKKAKQLLEKQSVCRDFAGPSNARFAFRWV